MIKRALGACLGLLVVSGTAHASPITVGGIFFPQGTVSFADAVVSFQPGTGVGTAAGPNCTEVFNNINAVIGLPDYNGCTGALALGDLAGPGSATLVVQFVDNSLTTSGNSTPDLHIFEVGALVESFFVDISVDGQNWLALGLVSGQPTSIDIDAIAGVSQGALYSFVRLRDDPSQTSNTSFHFRGPDIDAIGAISSGAPNPTVPEPSTWVLLGMGLAGMGVARRGRRHA